MIRMLAIALAAFIGVAHADPAPRWHALRDADFTTINSDQDRILHEPNALEEDGDGYLWVGTANGLARWDGYRTRVYVARPGDPGALPDNLVQCLHADPRGVLWIGTSSGGLARYDRDRDRFTGFGAGPDGLSHVSVRAIADDGSGGLWVGTDGGLDHLDPATGTVSRPGAGAGTRPGEPVLTLLRDRRGALWIGTPHGLLRWASGEPRAEDVPLPALGDADQGVHALYEDGAGRIWAGTRSSGAYVLESGQEGFRAIGEVDEAARGAGTDWITQIVEAGPGEVWLGTYDEGIRVVDTATWTVGRIRHDPLRPHGLPHDNIRVLHRDRSGLVWVGTNDGLGRSNAGTGLVTTVSGQTSRTDGISDPEVFSVYPAPDGRIWLGLRSNGVDILDPSAARVAAIRPDPSRPDMALPRARVWAIAAAPDGDVYLGTERGLYRTDPAGRAVARVMVAVDRPELRVTALLASGTTLWIATSEDGLWQYDLRTRKTVRNLTEAELTDRRVEALAADGERWLWVGTDHGLNRVDLASGAVECILPEPGRPASLSSGFVTSLLVDRQGRLWVGTLAGGVNLLEGRDGAGRAEFRHVGTAQGLPHPNVDALLPGPDDRIWVSTDDGIGVIEGGNLSVRALGRADGVAIPEYLGGSAAVTRQGEILFGGVGGLTVIRPDRLAPWRYTPPVVATEVRVGDAEVLPGALGDGRGLRLTIPPDANKLSVTFAALDYSAPERNRYAYRLDGYDRDWVASDAQSLQATYTNLPPGAYTLRIRGSNRDGVWTERVLSLPVRVLPAWYQTIWFDLAMSLAALLAVAGIVRSRTAYLRRRQAVLETQVAERTVALRQRTEELEEAKRELEVIAFVDSLTGLPNRRLFTEQFHRIIALAARRGESFALLLLDLDRFKQINDTLGHDAGDALLVEATRRFRAAVREADFVARLGGDEFAILLTDAGDVDAIELVCRRIGECFVEPVPYKGHPMKTSPSIGVALYPDHGETQEALFKAADLALYAAKRAGRNTWRWYGAQDAVRG